MFHIIANEISGRGKKAKEKLDRIKAYLEKNDIEYIWHKTEYKYHPTVIASEIEEKYHEGNIIVIGGDGTINEVIRGIKDLSKFNIGLVPTGSGNDFASNLGFNADNIEENIDRILKGNIKQLDYINVNDTKSLNVIGTGIDCLVLQKFEKYTKLKGSFRYLWSLISALFTFKWYEFDVSIDGKEFEHKKGFMVALCNGSTIGGGIKICMGAKPDDGKLEFVFINKISKISIPIRFISLMKGTILKKKFSEHVYCEKVTFKSDKEFVMQIDGNIDKVYSEYRCEIVKNGINFYC